MKETKLPTQLLAESGPQPTLEELGEITKLVESAWQLDERIEKGEALLAKLKEQLNLITTKQLPDLLAKFNLASFKTVNGVEVKIKPFYTGKIIHESAYEWLEENGHGGGVRTEVTLPLGKGEMEKGQAIVDLLVEHGYQGAVIDTSIHHATLNALVKEIMEKGETLPDDKFTTYSGRVAKISVAKKKQ